MSYEIGVIAGGVWHYLSENGESSPIKIKAALSIPNTMLYLALGWLSREDKVDIRQVGYSCRISLK
jgi:hypothetical protein